VVRAAGTTPAAGEGRGARWPGGGAAHVHSGALRPCERARGRIRDSPAGGPGGQRGRGGARSGPRRRPGWLFFLDRLGWVGPKWPVGERQAGLEKRWVYRSRYSVDATCLCCSLELHSDCHRLCCFPFSQVI
jgi:hypothetical protein